MFVIRERFYAHPVEACQSVTQTYAKSTGIMAATVINLLEDIELFKYTG